jgi:hypothetical protein
MDYEPWVEPAIEAAPAPDITKDKVYGYLPVGKSTVLPEPCQEFGQGSLGRETESGRSGDRETWGFLFSLAPSLSLSAPLWQNYGLLSSAGVSRNSTGS